MTRPNRKWYCWRQLRRNGDYEWVVQYPGYPKRFVMTPEIYRLAFDTFEEARSWATNPAKQANHKFPPGGGKVGDPTRERIGTICRSGRRSGWESPWPHPRSCSRAVSRCRPVGGKHIRSQAPQVPHLGVPGQERAL